MLKVGRRVRLRRMLAADLPFVVALWNEPALRRAEDPDHPVDIEVGRRWFRDLERQPRSAGEHLIVEDHAGRLLGTVGYHNVSLGSLEADCDILLHPSFMADEGAIEALELLLDHIFTFTPIRVLTVSVRFGLRELRRLVQTAGFKEQRKSGQNLSLQLSRDQFFRRRQKIEFNPRIGELTWRDVGQYLRDHDALILPLGSFEQHGPHLPFRTDTIVAEHVAIDIATDLQMLVSPPLEFGAHLPGERGMPGQASFSVETVRDVVGEILGGWRQSGFRTFYCIGGHGSDDFLAAIRASCPPGGRVFATWFYPTASDPAAGSAAVTGQRHAGDLETSVMLYLRPDLVRMECIDDLDPAEWRAATGEPSTAPEASGQGGGGSAGAPTPSAPPADLEPRGMPMLATREQGQEFYLHMVNELKRRMQEFALTAAARGG